MPTPKLTKEEEIVKACEEYKNALLKKLKASEKVEKAQLEDKAASKEVSITADALRAIRSL